MYVLAYIYSTVFVKSTLLAVYFISLHLYNENKEILTELELQKYID